MDVNKSVIEHCFLYNWIIFDIVKEFAFNINGPKSNNASFNDLVLEIRTVPYIFRKFVKL